ncbi:MAG: serine/threonine-protein kinase [Bacillota bacterium]|nr:serine/threonine-protein kinase [Bacillota bacterium]
MERKGEILDGRYEILKLLGEGGMGRVYLCRNIRLDVPVAIKEFKAEVSHDFISEPHILKKLRHRGIPQIFDIFEENGYNYMVEEYIEGSTLSSHLENIRNMDTDEVIRIALEICDIIEYLHSCNPPIIYRDLKPSNVLIGKDGSIHIIDFGISRVYKEEGARDTVYMGSVGYASPEQCGGGQSCRQTDVYGLGALLYFLMNRKAPANFMTAFNEKYGEMLPRIVIRAMQPEIDKRFPTITDMKRQLEKVPAGDSTVIMPAAPGKKIAAVPVGDNMKPVKRKVTKKLKFVSIGGLLIIMILVLLFAQDALKGTGRQDKETTKVEKPVSSTAEPVKSEEQPVKVQTPAVSGSEALKDNGDNNEQQELQNLYDSLKPGEKGKGHNKKK